MGDLTGIFIVGFIVLGVYRLFELFVRRKERMAIIDKLLGENIKFPETNVDLNLPLFQKPKSNWALKLSLLLIGIGMGLIVAYYIELLTVGVEWDGNPGWYFRNKMEVVYLASVAVFGGIGLLIAYFIEQKQKN